MPIEITCSQCHRQLHVADNIAGKRIRCPQCESVLTVPTGNASDGEPRWRVLSEDGQSYGPVTRVELAEWVREGRVTARSRVARGNESEWRGAAELFPQLLEPTPRAPVAHTSLGGASISSEPVSDRSLVAALLLAILLPWVGLNGIHRMYLGQVGIGILQLVTIGGCGIWQLIDVILLAVGGVRDAEGRRLA